MFFSFFTLPFKHLRYFILFAAKLKICYFMQLLLFQDFLITGGKNITRVILILQHYHDEEHKLKHVGLAVRLFFRLWVFVSGVLDFLFPGAFWKVVKLCQKCLITFSLPSASKDLVKKSFSMSDGCFNEVMVEFWW